MAESQRIVSLLSSATEIVFGIGAGERLAAVSHECDYPPAARQLPRATRSLIDSTQSAADIDKQVASRWSEGLALYELDADLIRRLRPSLILTQAQCDVCAIRHADVLDLVRSDEALRDTQVLALSPTTLADVFDDIQRVGQAAGCEVEAAGFVARLKARIDRIASRTALLAAEERPRVACIEWVEPLMLAANWTPELLAHSGGRPGLAEAGKHSVYSRWEALIEYDPEVLFISPCGFDLPRSLQEANSLQDRPGWRQLSAVRNGRVWVIDGNAYLNRPGPRLIDSLEILAHLTHPQIIERPEWSDPNHLPWAWLC